MKTAIRDPIELCRALGLSPESQDAAIRASRGFAVFVPLGYVARMRPGDPRDPLLRQVLPVADELQQNPDFTEDPVGDDTARTSPGLLRKYQGRALMITTGACAVHCRYCFRRHYPYAEGPHSPKLWSEALDEIANDKSIEEVILSGGDPLALVDSQLAELVHRLAEIPHLRRLRVHTRLPIVVPERVTDSLIVWFRGTRLVAVVVVHANHARELDEDVAAALAKLADAGVPLLNQAVLLRGVNDGVRTLVELSRRLLDCRVMPYCLHQLDRVAGAAHFEVPVEEGLQIVRQMRAALPGYAVPRFVREIPGEPSKRVLA
jgi:EF-P beta-lysylation protein EpmB